MGEKARCISVGRRPRDYRSRAEGEGEVAALARTFWTPEEDNLLRMLIEAGKPIEFIAAELNRSANAVKGRAWALRISLKRVKLKKAKGK
jgi:DNA-binding NarL/FixJ family response regulator